MHTSIHTKHSSKSKQINSNLTHSGGIIQHTYDITHKGEYISTTSIPDPEKHLEQHVLPARSRGESRTSRSSGAAYPGREIHQIGRRRDYKQRKTALSEDDNRRKVTKSPGQSPGQRRLPR